jgi:D-glycero-D-manno-heptose 1,7-bisphosphate phosphatase
VRAAFFLDRDGTLIVEKNYLSDLKDIALLDTVGETLRVLQDKGFLLLMITNQSAVARGIIDENFVKQSYQRINQLLLDFQVKLDDCFYCPHHPEGHKPYNINCDCRKPKAGMIEQAKKKICDRYKK